MRKARNTRAALLLATSLAAVLMGKSEVKAAAGGNQQCNVNSTCEVGEFVYDDEYAPVLTATCNITSREPDGDIFIDNELMSLASENDGWYSHTFTAPSTTGVYRTQVCCTVSGELMCVDKTVEVKEAEATASNVASSVWGSSSRTLSSFGNLTGDIWTYSSRTVSSFGDLVSSIWNNSTRTVTGISGSSGAVTTQSDLVSIKSTVEHNKIELDKLVNKPIIEQILEEEIPDLQSKLKETRTVANQIYVNNQFLITKYGTLYSKWNYLDESDLLVLTNEISEVLGEEGDSLSDNTIFGQVGWMKSSWSWDEVDSIEPNLINIRKRTSSIAEKLAFGNKEKSQYTEVKAIIKELLATEKAIGSSTDLSSDKSIYARIKTTEEIALKLDQKAGELDELYADLSKTEDIKRINPKIEKIKREIVALNKVPKIISLLTKAYTTDIKSYKNSLLGMKGIINANKILLSKGAGKLVTSTWIELGSIVFKTLVTNPSTIQSQEVDLKYYLPPEVKEEDVLEHDDKLTLSYDSEKGQYYVSGKISLLKGETKTFEVKVNDVWVMTKEEVESLRTQSDELFKPLEKTSYYAQGVSLKSDINASLDKIISLQDTAVTPEQKIRAYREAMIEREAVAGKLDGMKELVAQAGASGNLFGFVGGAQAIAVWGLIIIMAAGFVFLALYMKTITKDGSKGKVKTETGIKKSSGNSSAKLFKYILPLIVSAAVSALMTAFIALKVMQNQKNDDQVLGTQAPLSDQVHNQEKSDSKESGVAENAVGGLDIVKVVVEDVGVSVYPMPSNAVEPKVVLETTSTAVRIEQKGNWVRILLGDVHKGNIEGWVLADSIVGRDDNQGQELLSMRVEVQTTPTGWLRVRDSAGGVEIGRVDSGDIFEVISEENLWYEILLTDGSSGFISKDYSKVLE